MTTAATTSNNNSSSIQSASSLSQFMAAPPNSSSIHTMPKRRTVRTNKINLPLRKRKAIGGKNGPSSPSKSQCNGNATKVTITSDKDFEEEGVWKKAMGDLDKHIVNYRSFDVKYKEEENKLKKMEEGEMYLVNRANTLQKDHNEMTEELRVIKHDTNLLLSSKGTFVDGIAALTVKLNEVETLIEEKELKHDQISGDLMELNDEKRKVEEKQEKTVDTTTKQKDSVKLLKRKRKKELDSINKLKKRRIQLSVGDVRDEIKKKSTKQQEELTKHQKEITKLKSTIKDLENEIVESNDPLICKICMVNRWNVVNHCGHTLCKECSLQIDKCHICRGTMITQVIPKLIL